MMAFRQASIYIKKKIPDERKILSSSYSNSAFQL